MANSGLMKGMEVLRMNTREEEMMESLEMAFRRKWNRLKEATKFNLETIKDADEERWSRTLIGKLHTRRGFEEEDVKEELVRNWNMRTKFEMMKVDEGIFTIKEMDYLFVLENGPWDVHGYIMSFKQWSKDFNMEDFVFSFFPMWIHVYELPLERHIKSNIEMVGAIFGEVISVDSVGGIDERLPYVRVQVKYNIHHPMLQDVVVHLSEGKKSQVQFRYMKDYLSSATYCCGLLGLDYGVCKELKDCQRRFIRDLTREEFKQILTYSYQQKAKSYKFGSGIQTKHIIEVDLTAETQMEDKKFLEWRVEKMKEEEQRKRGSLSAGQDSQVKMLTNGQDRDEMRVSLVIDEQLKEKVEAGNQVMEKLLMEGRNKDADMVELNREKSGTVTELQLCLRNKGKENGDKAEFQGHQGRVVVGEWIYLLR